MSEQQKVWFITGCSTGFGRELAQKVISLGYKVVVTARKVESLQELKDQNEANVLTLSLDVTDRKQIQTAIAETIYEFGRIDVLVNNAGIGYFGAVEESDEVEVRRMFDINFWGLMDVTNAVLPHMRERKAGHIINISSIGGLASFPALGYYHATKYAVEGISESLSQELAPYNIHVSLIEPGPFRTDWAGRSSEKTESTLYQETAGKNIEDTVASQGQEPGNPEKAAEALVSVVEANEPPQRLLLGKVAYDTATQKFSNLLKSIEESKDTTLSADYQN
ncbi:NADP-dependent 3-hydroxy acid dehydrogenase YdfG [Terribacillus saccharophilus]|uniref:NADP-dependent 3-hydroxy acid dehydrogenase YdfG n=1 Tax=Terribacillus saccharophilus TaxID=361277 RepID=A0AAX2ED75_9BACI|nr:NADP-dependent 3-hydroxy acid dehydrogenase YdfG [Terribacillus saccharophilus]